MAVPVDEDEWRLLDSAKKQILAALEAMLEATRADGEEAQTAQMEAEKLAAVSNAALDKPLSMDLGYLRAAGAVAVAAKAAAPAVSLADVPLDV